MGNSAQITVRLAHDWSMRCDSSRETITSGASRPTVVIAAVRYRHTLSTASAMLSVGAAASQKTTKLRKYTPPNPSNENGIGAKNVPIRPPLIMKKAMMLSTITNGAQGSRRSHASMRLGTRRREGLVRELVRAAPGESCSAS